MAYTNQRVIVTVEIFFPAALSALLSDDGGARNRLLGGFTIYYQHCFDGLFPARAHRLHVRFLLHSWLRRWTYLRYSGMQTDIKVIKAFLSIIEEFFILRKVFDAIGSHSMKFQMQFCNTLYGVCTANIRLDNNNRPLIKW